MSLPTWRGVRAVLVRHLIVFRRELLYTLLSTLVEPLLYVVSFGFMVGQLIGPIHVGNVTLSYRAFVLSGMAGGAALYQGFSEGAYGVFIRMHYQRFYQGLAPTPVTMSEVLTAELAWVMLRGVLAAAVPVLLGVALGDFGASRIIPAVLVCIGASALFASAGLLSAALARLVTQLSYPHYLAILPMFFLCGVFFPLDRLPDPMWTIAWALPLTSVESLLRWAIAGTEFEPVALPIALAYLVILLAVSRRMMARRLVR